MKLSVCFGFTIFTLGALENKNDLRQLPKYKLRELVLAPIQVSLESSNTQLNSDALYALEVFIDSDDLYDSCECPIEETDLTFQFLDTISPCTIFSESIQASFPKLLLRLCLSRHSRLNVNSMLRIIQICTDINNRNQINRKKEKAYVARTTLVQAIEAFVLKNNACDNQEQAHKIGSRSVYPLLCANLEHTFDVSEPQLQILGVFKCLVETMLPENISTQNRTTVPIYLEAIATIISLLPVTMIRQRVFLNILWQRLCPVLMWFLSNPKEERSITSTLDLQQHLENGAARTTHGSASSVAPPTLWPEGLRFIYDIVIHLAYLVGPVRELRPMLESLFHKMLLYPPPSHRLDALNAVCRILESTEGILCIVGPLISIPALSSNSTNCCELPISPKGSHRPDFQLFKIILESIHVCSATGDQALVCASTKCVDAILSSLTLLLKGGGLTEELVQMTESQLERVEVPEALDDKESSNGESRADFLPNTNLPRTLEVDRWAAHDYLLSVMKIIPSLLDAQSTVEIDRILLEFSSSYCKELRSSVSGGILSPVESSEFADTSHVYDVSGTLLNADAVYVATFSALSLNYRLIKAGFYSTSNRATVEVMSEADFLDSILGTGLLLYVSETWLSQVYRGIRHQDLLSAAGLASELTHGPVTTRDNKPLRGSHLIDMLVEFSGVGWTFNKETNQSENTIGLETNDSRVRFSRVGQLIASSVLHVGWDYIVEALTNTVALAGMKVNEGAPSFIGGHPFSRSVSTACESSEVISESASRPLLQSLFGPLFFDDAAHNQQFRELGEALLTSLTSLQQMARLACSLGQTGLRARCSKVFALLTETASAALRAGPQLLPANRLHPAQALSIDVVLTSALELGCQSADCWVHLLNACQLVRDLEHAYFASVCNTERSPKHSLNGLDDEYDLSTIIQRFSSDKSNLGNCLTVEQTGIVLNSLSAQVDRIFDTAAEVLSLPALLDFVCCLLQASGAELASREQAQSMTTGQKSLNQFKCVVNSLKGEILKATKLRSTNANASAFNSAQIVLCNSHSPTLFLDRLSQLLLRAIRSPTRPLLHLLRVWALVSQHLVDACCFSSSCISSSFSLYTERLLVSKKALSCLHDCTVTTVTSRPELPYFNANEMFCKPFEILMRLELCDGDLQDRIISCISEVVEECGSALHSGWRSIFGTLRSINVPFLAEVDEQCSTTLQSESIGVVDNASKAFISTCPKVTLETEVSSTRVPTRRRVSTVLEIFEIFLFSDDLLVFCNIAVDCVRCLLRYLSAGEPDRLNVDVNSSTSPLEASNEKNIEEDGGLPPPGADSVGFEAETSCSLCKATLPLLTRCCELFGSIWTSPATVPSIDYVLRSAKRQAHLFSGGPPQLNLLPSVRSFTSHTFYERVKNLNPWFSTDRFMDPNFRSPTTVNPSLRTLRSLDDIDQPSGVLHLWFLTLEGIVMAIWDSNPSVHRLVFEEFTNLLDACIEHITGEGDIPVTILTDGMEREEVIAKNVALGPSFTVFVVNHALLPRLQAAVTSAATTGGTNDISTKPCSPFHKKGSILDDVDFETLTSNTGVMDEKQSDELLIRKLSFIVGQTVHLVCSLATRFHESGKLKSNSVVGMNLMLHQCLHMLVDCISVRNDRLSRLATSCLRHLLLSTASCLTAHQWELAIAHVEEAFRACLCPIHTLTSVHLDQAKRSLASDVGLQLANLRPIAASDKLRQLANSLFQVAVAPGESTLKGGSVACNEAIRSEKRTYAFEFWIFPLCTHEIDRPPLDV
uniref:SEC7 domain-containing protein n=1 Tax=Mesocestoides corti TaxID=53468 RepID=A0A5K3FNK2_MESCO